MLKKQNFIFLLLILLIILMPNLVKAESLDCNVYLMKGDSNNNVKVLQRKLNETMSCDLKVDGKFGSLTYKCVVNFQKKYNLSQDGIVGPKSCKKLNSITSTETSNQKNISTSNSTQNTTTNNSTSSSIKTSNKLVVTGTKVNIRQGASTNDKIIDQVKLGDVLTITGSKETRRTTWYKVTVNGKTGYISGMYAKKDCILLDISNQLLTYYKNGAIYMEANVVTGKKNVHNTPTGHYTLKVNNKEKARTLRGTNDDGSKYASYVDYWMPFITSRGIGFHDASWRDNEEFNKETYTYNGSHGCVNMKKEDAKKLYESTITDTDVVVIS